MKNFTESWNIRTSSDVDESGDILRGREKDIIETGNRRKRNESLYIIYR